MIRSAQYIYYMKTIIYNGRVICANSIIQHGYIGIENGLIIEIGNGAAAQKPAILPLGAKAYWIDAEGGYISPGFIDLHVHGVGICDMYKDTKSGLRNMARVLAYQGVTSFLPTLITAPLDEIIRAISIMADSIKRQDIPGAYILGINLEGPYINSLKAGVQPVKYIRRPSIKELNRIIDAAYGYLRIITIAPEIPGNLEIAGVLKNKGIIPAIGHTSASFEETENAIDKGIIYISHTFNAMSEFHHRKPGAVGAVLMRKEVFTEIIADGVHIHPAVLKFLCRLKENKQIILITDALTGLMRHGDKCRFAGRDVISNGIAAYTEDGLLTGSTTPMNRAVQNITRYTDLDLPEAVKLATINPARIMGVEGRKGTLDVGKDADIIIFGDDFNIKTTLIGGKAV